MLPCGLATAGCSIKARSTLSATSLESHIAADLALVYHVRAPAVRCPAGVTAQPGTTFTCTTVLDGQPLQLGGTVTDTHGHFRLRPDKAIIKASAATAQIAAELTKTFHRHTTVVCTLPALLVAKPGTTFRCTAVVAGVRGQVEVTVTNLAGALRIRVLPYGRAGRR